MRLLFASVVLLFHHLCSPVFIYIVSLIFVWHTLYLNLCMNTLLEMEYLNKCMIIRLEVNHRQ